MKRATRIGSLQCAVLGLASGVAAAGAARAQERALPRLLQPAPATLVAPASPVRTPTLVFKGAAWPASITTGALVHGAAGWPAVKTPALAFSGRAWPAAVTTARLTHPTPAVRAPLALQPAPLAASGPLLLNRSR